MWRWLILMLVATAAPLDGGRAGDQRVRSAVDVMEVAAAKRHRLDLYLTAEEAAAALKEHRDIALYDVRARADVLRTGIAEPARRNIPFFLVGEAGRPGAVDPEFVDRVVQDLAADWGGGEPAYGKTVILICSVGIYAAIAAEALAERGFGSVYTIVDGIEGDGRPGAEAPTPRNGWRALGLPWLAQPRADQMSIAAK